MNKPFTELPAPVKERLIIRLRFTKVLEPDRCESCHMARVPGPGDDDVPPTCAVCGRMLCRGCYGLDGTFTASDLNHYPICDECGDLEREETDAILELRAKLNQP